MFMAAPDRDPRWSYQLAGAAAVDLGCYSQRAHRALAGERAGSRVEQPRCWSSSTCQLEAFIAHLRDGVPLRNDAPDGVANTQLIDYGYRAADFSPRPRNRDMQTTAGVR